MTSYFFITNVKRNKQTQGGSENDFRPVQSYFLRKR